MAFIFNIFGYIISNDKYKFYNMIQEISYLLFFPGIVFHEFSREIFCCISKVKVVKVCYFQFKNLPGYVMHEEPRKYHQAFLISIGPSILGILFSVTFFILSKHFSNNSQSLELLFIWLGVSIAINCFPNIKDLKVLHEKADNTLVSIGNLILTIIFIFNLLQNFWANLACTFILYILSNFIYLNLIK